MTQTHLLTSALLRLGWKEVASGSSKYRTFESIKGPVYSFHRLFVGKAGALRVGNCVTHSRSLTHTPFYENLLSDYQRIKAEQAPLHFSNTQNT